MEMGGQAVERECMEFDVLVVGGGPAGLAAAIRIRQLAVQRGQACSVCVLEKAAEIGAHTLSGAVMDPRALDELLPDWRTLGAPMGTPVSEDRIYFLGEHAAWRIPTWLLPDCFDNHGNHIVRLGQLVKWLGEQAEALGVEVYPGFAAADLLHDEHGAVAGVVTGDVGLSRDGQPGPNWQPGMELRARYTVLAEGCRGHLGKQVEARYRLRDAASPQSYGLGLKELWEVPAAQHEPGLVVHTAGWPMRGKTYGGGFAYHLSDRLVAVGYVVGLGYDNPYLSPFEEFQRYKTHSVLRAQLQGGRRLAYGARAIAAGGLPSLPRTVFPGGVLVGDDAGFLNPARIKGVHAAIKTGMLAAEVAVEAIAAGRAHDCLEAFEQRFQASWLHAELQRMRNFKPLLKHGPVLGAGLFALDQKVFRGRFPWTGRNTADHEQLKAASQCRPIEYPKPDNVLSFDRLSSVFLSNTHHEEGQPCHLRLADPSLAISLNLARYDAPETRYCPAGVYEIVREAQHGPRLQINAQNCVHCKSCDIKDPAQNINWVPPQGGEGPIYQGM